MLEMGVVYNWKVITDIECNAVVWVIVWVRWDKVCGPSDDLGNQENDQNWTVYW